MVKWIQNRICIGFCLVIAMCVLISGCGSWNTAQNDVLTIGMTNAPESFNPLFNPGAAGQFTARFMYDTLVGMPKPNQFTPHLADSFVTQDNQHFTITLNPKAVWSDGTPITADDVVFTLNTIANPKVETSKGRYIMMLDGLNAVGKLEEGTKIPGLAAVDDHTVVLQTKRPVDPNYIKSLLGLEVFIIPKHVFEHIAPEDIAHSDAATKPSVTSGAYKFVSYKTNDHVELAANDTYYKGAPKLKKIFLRIMNGTNLVTELKAGNVQLAAGGGIGNIPIKDIDVLKKDTSLQVTSAPSFGGQYLEINNADLAFNTAFRRAVTMAINRKRIVEELYKGYAQIVPTVYSSVSPAYDKSVEPLPYDVEKAKQELAASGFDVSREITLQVPIGNVLREQSADLIQQDLQAVGLQVKQEKLDFPTILSNGRKGDYEMMLFGYALTVDPDYSAYFIPGGSNNIRHANDPELVRMFAQAASLTSAEERNRVYSQLQAYMRDHQFVTSLYVPDEIHVQSKRLKGGINDFWEGSLDEVQNWHFE